MTHRRTIDVATQYGPGRIEIDAAADPAAVLVLSHGAGNGIDTRDLVALAEALPAQGITVARFEQPWRLAGRKVASPPPTLDVGLRAAVEALADVLGRELPLVVGGRSAGARSACRSAVSVGAVGVLALAFPLYPPGKPERTRASELAVDLPLLVVQGGNDPMGKPEEFPAGIELAVVPAADHGLKVGARAPISQDEALGIVVESTLEWLVRDVLGTGRA